LKETVVCEWHVREHRLIISFGQKQYPAISLPGKLGAIYHTIIQEQEISLSESITEQMRENYLDYYKERDFDEKGYGDTWDNLQVQRDISTIRDRIRKNLPPQLEKLVNIASKRTYAKTTYYIPFPLRIIK